jgi:hypothetical protein
MGGSGLLGGRVQATECDLPWQVLARGEVVWDGIHRAGLYDFQKKKLPTRQRRGLGAWAIGFSIQAKVGNRKLDQLRDIQVIIGYS